MGLLKDNINKQRNIYEYLITNGFKYGTNVGPRGESGYNKTVEHNINEVLWITISPSDNKVYLYNEWDCGGMIWERTIDIPDNLLEDEDSFIKWLDMEIG